MPRIKTILFDFMGTCLDWHTSIASSLPPSIPSATRSAMALSWRSAYFASNMARSSAGLPPEDIDTTHRNTLLALLNEDSDTTGGTPLFAPYKHLFTPNQISQCISAWHAQSAWSDVRPALDSLKQAGYEIAVHANGTVRYQMDLSRSSGLDGCFSMLFSSELLGVYKPAAEAYERALALLKREPEEVVMVAAHASDTAGAKAVGIRSVYVLRWSEDGDLDQDMVRKTNDRWIVGMGGLVEAVKSLDSDGE